MDLAVAVVIGAAFGKIVSSLVENIVMPVAGIFLNGIDVADQKFKLGSAVIKYGVFIQNVVDFLIIALVIFLTIKALSHLKPRADEMVVESPKEPTEEARLLMEIRDLLSKNTENT